MKDSMHQLMLSQHSFTGPIATEDPQITIGMYGGIQSSCKKCGTTYSVGRMADGFLAYKASLYGKEKAWHEPNEILAKCAPSISFKVDALLENGGRASRDAFVGKVLEGIWPKVEYAARLGRAFAIAPLNEVDEGYHDYIVSAVERENISGIKPEIFCKGHFGYHIKIYLPD